MIYVDVSAVRNADFQRGERVERQEVASLCMGIQLQTNVGTISANENES